MCAFCRYKSTLRGGIGTHVGAETQEDLWLTDKQKEDVTKWSSSKMVWSIAEKGERKKKRKYCLQCFLTVLKATVGHLEKRSGHSQTTNRMFEASFTAVC